MNLHLSQSRVSLGSGSSVCNALTRSLLEYPSPEGPAACRSRTHPSITRVPALPGRAAALRWASCSPLWPPVSWHSLACSCRLKPGEGSVKEDSQLGRQPRKLAFYPCLNNLCPVCWSPNFPDAFSASNVRLPDFIWKIGRLLLTYCRSPVVSV